MWTENPVETWMFPSRSQHTYSRSWGSCGLISIPYFFFFFLQKRTIHLTHRPVFTLDYGVLFSYSECLGENKSSKIRSDTKKHDNHTWYVWLYSYETPELKESSILESNVQHLSGNQSLLCSWIAGPTAPPAPPPMIVLAFNVIKRTRTTHGTTQTKYRLLVFASGGGIRGTAGMLWPSACKSYTMTWKLL